MVGYSAAKWGTESSLSLAKASSTRTNSSLALIQANQIRTLDSVSFNAAETAYAANNPQAFPAGGQSATRGLPAGIRGLARAPPPEEPPRTAGPVIPAAVPDTTTGRGARAQRAGRRIFQQRPVRRGNGRQVCAPDGFPGRGAFPRWHRQPLPGPSGALWAGRHRHGAARRIGSATPRPSRTAVLTPGHLSDPGTPTMGPKIVGSRSPTRYTMCDSGASWRRREFRSAWRATLADIGAVSAVFANSCMQRGRLRLLAPRRLANASAAAQPRTGRNQSRIPGFPKGRARELATVTLEPGAAEPSAEAVSVPSRPPVSCFVATQASD
jgi:hypothetical protein